jgi:hypothetical protein
MILKKFMFCPGLFIKLCLSKPMKDSDREIYMNTGNWIFRIRMATAFTLCTILAAIPVMAQDQDARDVKEILEIPVAVVDGHLGRCTADFTVTDNRQVPIYDAKIDVTLRYGFLGLRKMSLQVGTNSEGKAGVAGLPDQPNKTFRFEVTSGKMSKTVVMNTSDRCNAEFDVVLEEE